MHEKILAILHRIVNALEVADAHKADLHSAIDDVETTVKDVEDAPKSDA